MYNINRKNTLYVVILNNKEDGVMIEKSFNNL